jgi:hypothetical protein
MEVDKRTVELERTFVGLMLPRDGVETLAMGSDAEVEKIRTIRDRQYLKFLLLLMELN